MTATRIQKATAAYYGIDVDELCSTSQRQNSLIARHVARYLERQTGKSFSEIGNIYQRDHASVILSVKHVDERLRAKDQMYVVPVEAITASTTEAVLDALACPTCGAPVIKEMQRKISELQARVNELQAAGLK